jgi:hypothetical protein
MSSRRMSGAKCCDKENKVQLECIRCLRALLNTESGFQELIQHRSIITRIAQSSLYHPRPRSKTDIPKSRSGSSMSSFGSDSDVSTAATKLFTQTLELFTALCQKNRTGYTVIMETMSTIPNENYRFEHLMMALRSPACQDPDDLLPGTSTEWEYKDAAFTFVNAIIDPLEQIEDRMMLQREMKRRGLDERIEVRDGLWMMLDSDAVLETNMIQCLFADLHRLCSNPHLLIRLKRKSNDIQRGVAPTWKHFDALSK